MTVQNPIADLPYGEEADAALGNQDDPFEGVLGRQVDHFSDSPEDFKLDVVPNPHPKRIYFARFTAPEFTSLCPKTRQPDHATIFIDYIPGTSLVESKSLKLFMFSFRNHGAFHEACVNLIRDRIWEDAEPRWLRVVGQFNARGGIPIDVVCYAGQIPAGILPTDAPAMPLSIYRPR